MVTGTSRFGFVVLLAAALIATCLWLDSRDGSRSPTPQPVAVPPHVEQPQPDVFYVLGPVGRPGPIEVPNLIERRLSVKIAVVVAGTPATLPWPSYAQLFRRIGENEDLIFELDFDRIFRGEVPELLLKHLAIHLISHRCDVPRLAGRGSVRHAAGCAKRVGSPVRSLVDGRSNCVRR